MLGETLSRIPFVRMFVAPLRALRARKRFSGDQYGGFYGVYASFDEALADAPSTKPVGYDQPALVADYRRLLDEQLARPLESYEEPVVRILEAHLARNPHLRIADFGGNVGTHFYAYRTQADLADAMWTVVDVPQITNAGISIAAERGLQNLRFVTTLDSALPADVLLASGSLFYLSKPLDVFSRADAPDEIILNRMPLGSAPGFVTLQNGGPVFYPQWVLSRAELLGAITRGGYTVVLEWEDHVDSCFIPLHPELAVPFYTGLHLKRARASSDRHSALAASSSS